MNVAFLAGDSGTLGRREAAPQQRLNFAGCLFCSPAVVSARQHVLGNTCQWMPAN